MSKPTPKERTEGDVEEELGESELECIEVEHDGKRMRAYIEPLRKVRKGHKRPKVKKFTKQGTVSSTAFVCKTHRTR